MASVFFGTVISLERAVALGRRWAYAAPLAASVVITLRQRELFTLTLALVGLALWLLRQDVAPRTVKGSGLTRFIAVCLLSGYVWLAVGGISILASGGLDFGGALYDAALHAVLLAGDWMLSPEWRAWGGMLNGVALVAFVLGTIAAVIRGRLSTGKWSAWSSLHNPVSLDVCQILPMCLKSIHEHDEYLPARFAQGLRG